MALPQSKRLGISAAADYVVERCGVSREEARVAMEQAWRESDLRFFGPGDKMVTDFEGATIKWGKDAIQVSRPFDSYRIEPVIVYREHLEQWIAQGVPAEQATPPRRSNSGGAPRKYDWDAFHIEIIRIAHHDPDGLPERAKLTEHMKQWCAENWRSEPTDSVLRDKVARIYRSLGLD